jgi:hypothetical protein
MFSGHYNKCAKYIITLFFNILNYPSSVLLMVERDDFIKNRLKQTKSATICTRADKRKIVLSLIYQGFVGISYQYTGQEITMSPGGAYNPQCSG